MPSTPDLDRYRANVGLALFHPDGRVFVGRRVGIGDAYAWQMPQGGIDPGEDFEAAALRELEEEIGVTPRLVEVLDRTPGWLVYDFPEDLRAQRGFADLGQKQVWFALRFLGADGDIALDRHTPEFDAWRWTALAETPGLVIPFKRAVYEEVARRFARFGAGGGA